MNSLNNEQIGVSAEIAIADVFGVPVTDAYRMRGVPGITHSIVPIIKGIFIDEGIPAPIKHVAERQNPIDFVLANGQTASVKTNKQKLGKAAPQRIGQASSKTWFLLLASKLGIASVPLTYPEKVVLFKMIALSKIDELLAIYWENIFDCDYLIHIFNVVDALDLPTGMPQYIVIKKTNGPIWDPSKISFTKPVATDWNESNTVKYDGVTIGEFQVHNNRDNFKFRFNMAGITTLMQENRLTFSSE